jgi:hypothetical protein
MPCIDPAPPVGPRDIVRAGLCIGCGACAGDPARMALDRYGQFKPVGDGAWMRRRTAEFAAICPFSPHAADETRNRGRPVSGGRA